MHIQRRGTARHQLSLGTAQEFEAPGAVLVRTAPRQGDADRALRAGDHHAIRQADCHRGGHLRDDAGWKAQHRRGAGIDAGIGEGCAALHLNRLFLARPGADGRCRNQAAHRHRIAADIHDAAAGEFVGIQPAFRPWRRLEAEARLDVAHFANGAFTHKLHHSVRHRVGAVHERLHEEAVVDLGRVHHRHHLRMVEPHGLFAQHGLAGLERLDGPLCVLRVRRRDVHRVHIGIVEQGLIAPVRRDALPGLTEGLRRGGGATSHRRQRGGFGRRDGSGESMCDSARGQDAPTSFHADSADCEIKDYRAGNRR